MSIILKPLKKNQLSSLKKVFADRIKESNLQMRSTPELCLFNAERGYDGKYLGAYADSVEDPKVVLIMTHFPGMATFNMMAFINLIYIVPEKRGDADVVEVLLRTAENYARLNGADSVIGTSWIYRGAKDTSKMWIDAGFEPQEKIFIKHLEEDKPNG
jgi:hypothetical protein